MADYVAAMLWAIAGILYVLSGHTDIGIAFCGLGSVFLTIGNMKNKA